VMRAVPPFAVSGDAAEYKQVTLLFADVVRSMDIAAALDMERLHDPIAEPKSDAVVAGHCNIARCQRVLLRHDLEQAGGAGELLASRSILAVLC
jgi:hypothetical protein